MLLNEKIAIWHHQAAAAECGTSLAALRCYLEKRGILQFLTDIREDGMRAAQIVRNLLERAVVYATPPELALSDLPPHVILPEPMGRTGGNLGLRVCVVPVMKSPCSEPHVSIAPGIAANTLRRLE